MFGWVAGLVGDLSVVVPGSVRLVPSVGMPASRIRCLLLYPAGSMATVVSVRYAGFPISAAELAVLVRGDPVLNLGRGKKSRLGAFLP